MLQLVGVEGRCLAIDLADVTPTISNDAATQAPFQANSRTVISWDKNDLEDLGCATMCLPCTVAQMSRHTANYDAYEAVCCSKTGLPDGVRVSQLAKKGDSDYLI